MLTISILFRGNLWKMFQQIGVYLDKNAISQNLDKNAKS